MVTRRTVLISALGLGTLAAGVALATPSHRIKALAQRALEPVASQPPLDMPVFREPEPWAARLVAGGEGQIGLTVNYDPAYERIAYPQGDVPIKRGVCTDVVIRAYRFGLSVDLQKLVHEDMAQHFAAYPTLWGLKKPDPNIDHRRVPNLATYWRRQKAAVPVTSDPDDWRPGDIFTQMVGGRLPHTGIVSDRKNTTGTPLVIHNIGGGTREEDALFDHPLTGHFRWKI